MNDYSVGEIWKMLKMLCDEVPEVGKAYTECMIKGYGIAALISVILCGVAFFDKGVTKVKKL